ncbi:MAG: hypothetical protein ABI361_13290 [Nitrososphaera sp.]|jgi:hypothetical protein
MNPQSGNLKSSFLFVGLVALLGAAILSSSFSFRPASAHVSKTFGNLTVELGWNNEPAIAGQLNAAQLTIFTGSSSKPQPVLNAVSNLDATLQYGTVTKKLDFLPSGTTDGQYLATILPTREGSYSVHFKGTVNNQNIDTTINLDDVASSSTIEFPPVSSGSTGISTGSGNATGVSSAVLSQLGGIISQLTNDVDAAKKSADQAAQNSAAAQQSVSDAKAAADRAYMVGITGIGVGAAGIVIAVIALNRRESKLIQR